MDSFQDSYDFSPQNQNDFEEREAWRSKYSPEEELAQEEQRIEHHMRLWRGEGREKKE